MRPPPMVPKTRPHWVTSILAPSAPGVGPSRSTASTSWTSRPDASCFFSSSIQSVMAHGLLFYKFPSRCRARASRARALRSRRSPLVPRLLGAALFQALFKAGLQAHLPLALDQLVRQGQDPFLVQPGGAAGALVGLHHRRRPEVPLPPEQPGRRLGVAGLLAAQVVEQGRPAHQVLVQGKASSGQPPAQGHRLLRHGLAVAPGLLPGAEGLPQGGDVPVLRAAVGGIARPQQPPAPRRPLQDRDAPVGQPPPAVFPVGGPGDPAQEGSGRPAVAHRHPLLLGAQPLGDTRYLRVIRPAAWG